MKSISAALMSTCLALGLVQSALARCGSRQYRPQSAIYIRVS